MEKHSRVWARVQKLFTFALVALVSIFGLSVVYASDAQPEMSLVLPSSPAPGAFSPWKNMHPSTFDLSIEAVKGQCDRALGTEPWLREKHCVLLTMKLEGKQCREVMVPDGTKLDRLLGRVDGGKGKSKPWAKQEKQTGRLDHALLCDLEDGVFAYWFTGDKGKSCNNVAFVHVPPPLVPPPLSSKVVEAPPPPSPPPPPSGKWVCVMVPVGQVVQSSVSQHLDGFVIQDKCCCGSDTIVPSFNFNLGDTVNSGSGYAEQCFFQQP